MPKDISFGIQVSGDIQVNIESTQKIAQALAEKIIATIEGFKLPDNLIEQAGLEDGFELIAQMTYLEVDGEMVED